MRKMAPLCTGLSFAVTMPRLSVMFRSPLRTAVAIVPSQLSTASSAVAPGETSIACALMYTLTVSLISQLEVIAQSRRYRTNARFGRRGDRSGQSAQVVNQSVEVYNVQ